MLARIRAAMEAKKGDSGFTLIELLVVVIIIGILAGIATPIYLSQKQKATDASIKSDIRTLADQEETYAVDNQDKAIPYATTAAALDNIKFSTGNQIYVKADELGYCIQGFNTKGNATTITTKAFWYDSRLGGLQAKAGAAPAGGACAAITGTGTKIS